MDRCNITKAAFPLKRAYQVVYWREFSPGLAFPTTGLTYQSTRPDAELVASHWEARNLRIRDGKRTAYAQIIEISAGEIAERDLVPSHLDAKKTESSHSEFGMGGAGPLIHLERAN